MSDPTIIEAPESEMAVLGAMAMDADAAARGLDLLEAEDFQHGGASRVFGAAERLHERGTAVDAVTLSEELKASDELEAVGGMAGLARLVDVVPNADGLEDHARLLRERRMLRELGEIGRACQEATRKAGPGQAADILSALEDRLTTIQSPATLKNVDVVTLADALDDPTALEPPDPVAANFAYAGHATIAAGPPKGGKTTLLQSLAAAVSDGASWLEAPTHAGPVVWLMGEGDRPEILRGLHQFGASPRDTHVVMAGADPIAELETVVEELAPSLVVVDTWNTWSAPLGLDNWRSDSVAPVLRRVERIIRGTDTALVMIHHTRKADDEPMDSTSIKAWADLIRIIKPGDQPDEREVIGEARGGFQVEDFVYRLVEDARGARVELVDPEREIEERLMDFVERHPGCSKRDIRSGVAGDNAEIDDHLNRLVEGGFVERDRSGRAHTHRIHESPQEHAASTVQHSG